MIMLHNWITDFTSSPALWIACLVFAVGLAQAYRHAKLRIVSRSENGRGAEQAYDVLEITPLKGFRWRETEPTKIRPFKDVYHITMGLRNDVPSNLITIDSNYPNRLKVRRQVLVQQGDTVCGCLPEGTEAVRELYGYLMGEYLPKRYPDMFALQGGDGSPKGGMFQNMVTGERFPASLAELGTDSGLAAEKEAQQALRRIGTTIEDDMFLLHETAVEKQPSNPNDQKAAVEEEQTVHRVVAFICCFPAGFNPSEKLGKALSEVHGPVPGYEKIGRSMEKYFGRMEVGRPVKRVNWGIQTHERLFVCESHGSSHDTNASKTESIEFDKTFLRVELQTLTRLPRTRALLFSFKTYMYPLREIVEDGLGEELAVAVEGLGKGNAPGMGGYKGSERWGGRVCELLRMGGT